MKKKIIVAIVLIVALTLCLVACNNQIYDFSNAYIKVGDNWVDVKIDKWTDYADGEQIELPGSAQCVSDSQITALALRDLGIEDADATIAFVSTESVPWLDYDVETYILTAHGVRYIVGVQRNGTDIHYVDVICEV